MADLGARLSNAVSDVLHEAEDEMSVKWVAVLETMDADGVRGVWTVSSDGALPWDKVGLLSYGLARQTASMTAELIADGS